MNKFRYWMGLSLSLALLGYFLWNLASILSWRSLIPLITGPGLVSMLAAIFLYCLVIPSSAWAWTRLLAEAGEKWSVGQAAVLMGTTQLAKYIPGNVAQHLGRASLAIAHGMNPAAYGITVLTETILAVFACLLLAVFSWVWVGGEALAGLGKEVRSYWHWAMGALASLALIWVGLKLAVPKLNLWVTQQPKMKKYAVRAGALADWRISTEASAAYIVNCLLIGLGMWLVSWVLVEVTPGYWYLTAVFTTALMVGYLAPGLPAGIGAREGVLLLLLGGTMPSDVVLLLTLAMRAVTVLGDLLIFVVSVLLFKHYLEASEPST